MADIEENPREGSRAALDTGGDWEAICVCRTASVRILWPPGKVSSSSSASMANDFSMPDDLRNRSDKRGNRDRRKKGPGRPSEEDDGGRRGLQQRDRRSSKNFRDLLYGEDEEDD